MKDLPVVDETKCTGCGECVEVCPTDCLGMAGRIAWLPRPGDCVSCAACELICPSDAIRLEAASTPGTAGVPPATLPAT